MNIRTITIILLISILTLNCNFFEKKEKKKEIVARVQDKILYINELESVIDDKLSESDSILHAQNYIDSWVKEQLLLNRAELNLTEEQKNVEQQLRKYRSSLLIYKYQSEFVKQKLDTVISTAQIEEYYQNNQENFKLSDIVVKGLFIKIPVDAPEIYKVRNWYRSSRQADSTALADYCYEYAEKFDDFNGEYTPFKTIMKQIPENIENPEVYLKYNNSIEASDSQYKYYLRIDDYLLKTDISPLQFVQARIKNIILKKRELQLISEMENKLYQDAVKNNSVEIIR